MKLHKLLGGAEVIAVKGDKYIEINGIFYDSKQLKPGGLFFAIKGTRLNGQDFIDEAIERGAVCIVSESDFITFKNVCKVIVKDARKACANIANNFYQHPSREIKVIGITGTNGKTTTLHLVEAILKQAGKGCGTMGTISYNMGERRIPATNTTPSAIMIQMFLREMVKARIPYCVMEVSSHSLHQCRVEGIRYKSAIFTNLSNEHLDYHQDMQGYLNAKRKLFEMLEEDGSALVNADDPRSKEIIAATRGRVTTYAIKQAAEVSAQQIKFSIKGSSFKVDTPSGALDIKTSLIGEYNIYNILGAISFAVAEGIGLEDIREAIRNFKGAPGRLQKVDCGQDFSVFVDYAHTDDAIKNVLGALKKLSKKRIITVFGCGGDRDRSKRPRMGKAAAELADFLIITSDNPRSENPKGIIDEIVKGLPCDFKDYKISLDRKKAIEGSLEMAKDGDIVLIAGKGHETYQVLKDTVVGFDDCKIVEDALGAK